MENDEAEAGGYPAGWDWDDGFECGEDTLGRGIYEESEWRRNALDEETIGELLSGLGREGWSGAAGEQRAMANKGLAGGLLVWALDCPGRAEMFVSEAMPSMAKSSDAWSMALIGLAALGARMGRGEPLLWKIETRLVDVDSGLDSAFQVFLDMDESEGRGTPWRAELRDASYAAMRVALDFWEPSGGDAITAEQFVMGCMPVMEKVKNVVFKDVAWQCLARAWDSAACSVEIDKVALPGAARARSQSL